MTTKLLYRVSEASEITGISRTKLYELMKAGQIESVKVGKLRLLPHDALESFIAELRNPNAA